MPLRPRAPGRLLLTAVGAVLSICGSAPALAQAASSDPNPGALTFTGVLDVPSVSVFRGILQEADPKLTLWPAADVGLALFSGAGGLKSVGVNFGVWHSLQTGSSGTDGPSDRLHYEEDFHARLILGFGGGLTVAAGYVARTSPNNMFSTVKEFQVKVSQAHLLAPYGFLATELSDDGQADLGLARGTYLELGLGPRWPLAGGKVSLTVPVTLGLSLGDYYELDGTDRRLGFFGIGARVTVPLAGVPGHFGSWNIHGGADLLQLGATTRAANSGEGTKVVAIFGVGLVY